MTRPGELPLEVVANPEPNRREREIARDIAWSLGYLGSIADDPTNVAGMLALIREGYSLEGPRSVVSGAGQLPRVVFARPDADEAIESVTEHAWRSWFRELRRRGLRPCGWPVEQRTYLAIETVSTSPTPYVEIDDPDRADYLMISVSCEAVPMT